MRFATPVLATPVLLVLLLPTAVADPEPSAAEFSRRAVEAAIPLLDDSHHGEAALRVVTGAWDRAHAYATLEARLPDPDVVVGPHYLGALERLSPSAEEGGAALIAMPSGPGTLPLTWQRWMPALAAALPKKRGPALVAALDLVLRGDASPKSLTEAAVRAWPLMTPEFQQILLEYEWERIGSPAMAPLLEKALDLPARTTQWHVANLRSLAVERLVELGSERAKRIVLEDLQQDAPELSGGALTSLPPEAVPDLDAHFRAALEDPRKADLDKIAPLLERYGSPALVDLAVDSVHRHRWACSIQAALLRYVLRHDRPRALEELRFALTRRGGEETGCYRSVLGDVLPRAWGADAEALALSALADPDLDTRRDVADLLFNAGSPACATPLLDRLEATDTSGPERDHLLGRFLQQERWPLTDAERERLRADLPSDYARLIFAERYGP